jgi:hypothetical protein
VIQDRGYSYACTYRKKLDAGKVFYGKNGMNFDAQGYSDFLDKYDALSTEEQQEFRLIVSHFQYWNRGARDDLLYVTPCIRRLASMDLLHLDQNPSRILPLLTLPRLKSMLDGTSLPANAPREKIISYLAAENPPAVRALTDEIAYVAVPPRLSACYEEFFHDYILNDQQPPKLAVVRDAHPDILKQHLRG